VEKPWFVSGGVDRACPVCGENGLVVEQLAADQPPLAGTD
jgi:hypothetical protein